MSRQAISRPDLAAQARVLYYRERRLWELRTAGVATDHGLALVPRYDGGVDKEGKFWRPVWPGLAAALLEAQVEPASYFAFAFGLRSAHPPTPHHLTAAGLIAAYKAGTSDRDLERQLALTLASQEMAAASQLALYAHARPGWPAAERLAAVLADSALPLSALYRVCRAWAPRLGGVVGRYELAAAVQYAHRADRYDVSWAVLLPAGFGHWARCRAAGRAGPPGWLKGGDDARVRR